MSCLGVRGAWFAAYQYMQVHRSPSVAKKIAFRGCVLWKKKLIMESNPGFHFWQKRPKASLQISPNQLKWKHFMSLAFCSSFDLTCTNITANQSEMERENVKIRGFCGCRTIFPGCRAGLQGDIWSDRKANVWKSVQNQTLYYREWAICHVGIPTCPCSVTHTLAHMLLH